MNKEEIIKLLKEHKVDTYDACVATSCDEAWEGNKRRILRKHPEMTFDEFCDIAEDMWSGAEDATGLTSIADWVAEWLSERKDVPEDFYELWENYGS